MSDRQRSVKLIGASLILALIILGMLHGLIGIKSMTSASAYGGDWPHKFYGDIEIDGAPSPIGREVEARGEGVDVDVQGNPITTTEIGKYGGPNPHDPKLNVQGDVGGGTAIKFYVDGVRAQCREVDIETGEYIGDWENSFPFQAEGLTELDLSVTGEYTLTLVSEGCCPISVTYDVTTDTVAAGAVRDFTNITGGVTVTLEAGTDPLCGFGSWEGDLVSTSNPVSIPMRYEDKVITATCFSLEEYTFTVHTTGSGEGSVIKVPDQITYIHGAVVTLTAVPSKTSVFAGWSGDLEGDEERVVLTMDDDRAVTATFDFYSVTVSPEVDEKTDDPGEWVYYNTLQVTNTGGVRDAFTVTAVGSRDWSIVAPSSVDPMVPGDSEPILVGVRIPSSDVAPGDRDVVTLTLTSRGDPRKSATALLNTTVTGDVIFLPLVTRNVVGSDV